MDLSKRDLGATASSASDVRPDELPASNSTPHPANPSWREIPDDMLPLVAALNAAASLNRLRFHLEQAWFGYVGHQRTARQVLGALGRAVRNLVPAADRRGLQQAITRPFEGLLDQIASEVHFLAFEDWIGEFADETLTVEDFHRVLQPVFDAIDAARTLIEVQLDGPARLAFELGEVLDQGVRPPGIYRELGRPRQAPGQLDGEFIWRSVRSGEVAPGADWYENARQILVEFAVALDLRADAFALEQTLEDEATGTLVVRLVEGVEAKLITSHERRGGDNSEGSLLPIEPRDETSQESSTRLEGVNAPDLASDSVSGDFKAPPTSPKSHQEWDPSRFSFDGQSCTVLLDGKEHYIKERRPYDVFYKIYKSTCFNKPITGDKLGTTKVKRLLGRWLPLELNSLISRRSGKGGGYILKFPPKSP